MQCWRTESIPLTTAMLVCGWRWVLPGGACHETTNTEEKVSRHPWCRGKGCSIWDLLHSAFRDRVAEVDSDIGNMDFFWVLTLLNTVVWVRPSGCIMYWQWTQCILWFAWIWFPVWGVCVRHVYFMGTCKFLCPSWFTWMPLNMTHSEVLNLIAIKIDINSNLRKFKRSYGMQS